MTLRERVWGLGVAALRPLLPAAGLVSAKAAAAAEGRKKAGAALERRREFDDRRSGDLLWLHGASAGELLGAAPVVERLRAEGGADVDLLATYASPSAEDALPLLRPDAAEFAPLDTVGECRRAIRAVRPSALVFARGDLWPNLTRAADAAGVPAGMINATVPPDSSRLRPLARGLLRPGYGRLERVGAASGGDARRLRRMGVREQALEVTGDAAVDRALSEAGSAEASGPARRLSDLAAGGRPVLVAGSTWPRDEELLLEARRLLAAQGGAGPLLVLVPHEPGPGAVERIRRLCRDRPGRAPAEWDEDGPPPPARVGDLLVVNRTGLLARLYAAADLAWVGGGLGDDGLHSVVEPAAAGVPVLFGPRGTRREARELLERGAAWRLSSGGGPDDLAEIVGDLLADGGRRRSMGEAARGFAEENAGAADRAARLVAELLDASPPGPRPHPPRDRQRPLPS